jgi:hypothetical protein
MIAPRGRPRVRRYSRFVVIDGTQALLDITNHVWASSLGRTPGCREEGGGRPARDSGQPLGIAGIANSGRVRLVAHRTTPALTGWPLPDQDSSALRPIRRATTALSQTVRAKKPPIRPPQSTPQGGPSPSGGWARTSSTTTSRSNVAKTATDEMAVIRSPRLTFDARRCMTAPTANAVTEVSSARPRMR